MLIQVQVTGFWPTPKLLGLAKLRSYNLDQTARSPSIDGSQNGLSSVRYFGLRPAQPLRLALVDPTDRYLRAWKPVPSCLQFDQQRVLSRSFSLLPLPTAALTIMAKRKATTEELGARSSSRIQRL